MKITCILSLALFACVAPAAVHAQATKTTLVDSVNKQLQRGAKHAKSNEGALVKTNTAAAKSSTSAATKPMRVVAVPVITPQSTAATANVARVTTASDSGSKPAPPVRRAAKTMKTKPPAK